jgi:transglutaminase superfamily protein
MHTWIVANLALLLGLIAWLARRAWPPTEAVRLRNAFLVDPGLPRDFDWRPETRPPGYFVERGSRDPFFSGVVEAIGLPLESDDWTKALRIAIHLVENAQDKGPIRADPHTSYRRIRAGYGYCADFVKVFIALAHAAGLEVRQWGFSFDGFGGHGHTLVDVYDRARSRWLMLDVYNNFHVVDVASGEPLGALEYREALLGLRGRAVMERNGPGRLGFEHAPIAVEYYRRGLDEWYLLWGNAVLSHYGHPMVRLAGRFSRPLADIVASAVGVLPRMRVYVTEGNVAKLRRMQALRARLVVAAGVGMLLFGALLVQILIIGRTRMGA